MSKVMRRASIVFVVIVAVMLIGYWLMKDNIHTVVPKHVYRSAQLNAPELKRLIETKHIKSIINLRGANPKEKWYRNEIKVSKVQGVLHYDLRMYAYKLPSSTTLKKLVALLQSAPRPVLIHCEGGADRTGLASAFIILLKGGDLSQAKKQISWFYFAFKSQSVGKLVLPYYKRWLKRQHAKSSRLNFLRWTTQKKLMWQRQ